MFGLPIAANVRLVAMGVSALIALGALAWLHSTIKESGRAEVRAEIERQDREAVDAAREARSPVRRCIDDGGLWSTASGKCLPRGVPGVHRP